MNSAQNSLVDGQRLIDSQPAFALSFSGQGYPWLPTLRSALASGVGGQLANYLAEASDILRPVQADIDVATPQGFDPLLWARRDEPDDVAAPAISTPGILFAQLAVVESLQGQGLDTSKAVTAIGHSQGELAALVARGEATPAQSLAIAQLIGAAISLHARATGLRSTSEGPAMLAVSGVSEEQLTQAGAVIGLRNGADRFVIVGAPAGNQLVRRRLEAQAQADAKAVENKEHGGTPFNPRFSPLDVHAAYHHPDMAAAVQQVEQWGTQCERDSELVAHAARAVLTDFVDWPTRVTEAADAGAELIFECGPANGVEPLTKELVEGRGIGTLVLSSTEGQAQLFDAGQAPARPGTWEKFLPHVENGRLRSRFSEVTGYSPVMLPGMTPTTVDPEIVAAAANAGHWAELAGGGQNTASILDANLAKLTELLEPGVSAQFNAMYLSAAQWRRQIAGQRAIPKARANGAPISGVIVSAGIPPQDEAVALVEQLHADNFPWVAFKPGTVQQIEQTLRIADAVDTPIIMQVEGGHAGGHHSWEDLDELLLATYADIRERDNVLLAVGGGIGSPERGADYLLGTWATTYGRPAMPVDAIMIGTAAMAAKESTASADVKQALVANAGIAAGDNHGWAPAGKATGAVVSSRSQLGADLHEIDNAWARTGRLLEEVAGDADSIQARRGEIIDALNSTAKPYFGDVADMTYREWLERYLELSFRGKWVDVSWFTRFVEMVARTESRLSNVDHGEFEAAVTVEEEDPEASIAKLSDAYSHLLDLPVHPGDVAWFITLLEGRGKPANFVPVIDAEIRRRWREDSLWQAHDERYAADEVSIIPGTTAVAGIESADEPIADLLRRFEDAAAQQLQDVGPQRQEDATERIAAAPAVTWAGKQRVNPARVLLGHETGATLEATGENTFALRVPVAGSELNLELQESAISGGIPEVTNAAAAMRELAAMAAGGTLPEVTGNQATCTASLDTAGWTSYNAVTAGCVPADAALGAQAADVLVGKAWPAVFAVIADAQTKDGTPVVEGLLDLVHLEHGLTLHDELPDLSAGPVKVQATATAGEAHDTEMGRKLDVNVELVANGESLATLKERFLLRGRGGKEAASAPLRSVETTRETPPAFRHQVSVRAPRTMDAFARVSGDLNPIHRDDNAARLAGLPDGVIVHGMWTSALGQLAAGFDGAGLESWQCQMLNPVLPGQLVDYEVTRVGIDAHGGEVRRVTATVDGVPVLSGLAAMSAPKTFYGFPGQGIQHPGMGMDAYAASPAARDIWDRADKHTRAKLGFSLLEIVRNNPARVVVDGEEFTHPDGALYLTQFTQVAMATLGCAQVAEMKEAGILVNGAFFAGHSVGEYNALAAYAQVLSLEAVIEIVYRRGLTMHRLVDRDEAGNSNYGLAALRPNKMGLGSAEVFDFVAKLSEDTGEFLEIVNYNIDGVQYAVAGTRAGLKALHQVAEQRAPGKRTFIQIPGIDVPFHSSHLLGGVPDFREHLESLIPDDIDLDVLEGRYIPNLVARPFTLDREFVESITDVVDSPVINDILADFGAHAANPVRLGRTLLIELLAWQFASPVRWIETQDLLLDSTQVAADRFVEIGVGSSPTLANMLGQTLRLPHYDGHPIEVLNIERDRGIVFAEDAVDAPATEVIDDAPEATEEPEETPTEVVQQTAPAAAAAPTAERPTDLPVDAAFATEVLVAVWTKVRLDQMGPTDTIEALVEGVSSRRNQLLLDVGSEFGLGAIDGAADAPIAQLGQTVKGMAKGYSAFGPVLDAQVSEALRSLTGPAGKKPSYITERVTQTWGLDSGWADRVAAELLLGTRDGASLRGGDLATLPTSASNAGELDALIDAAVHAAGQRVGIEVTLPSAGASSDAMVDSAALSELRENLTADLAETARTLLRRLGVEEQAGEESIDTSNADALQDLVTQELGPDWPQLVTPTFDEKRAVLLDDRWASAREDLARAAAGVIDSSELDLRGTGEEVAAMAEYLGFGDLAEQARSSVSELEQHGKVAVVTGASPSSIAAAVTAELLSEGATVVATCSRLNHDRLEFYKQLYREHAVGEAALWVAPANLNSFQDVSALAQWIGNEQTTTVGASSKVVKPALVPDLLYPFAAPSVHGTLAEAGSPSEAQMRLLLWSVEKLIAELSTLGGQTDLGHRLHVVLPGSPNRGIFGGDGAYGESKAALDALVNRWSVEPRWSANTTLAHAHIGWVRGTGLMAGNDPLVGLVEERGVQTYSTEEIAKRLVNEAASSSARESAASEPVTLDFTGGLAEANLNLPELAAEAAENAENAQASSEPEDTVPAQTLQALPSPRAAVVETEPDFGGLTQRLEDIVVIVGAGELGPLGSSRTRFEVEVGGDLSAAGVVELAWTTGLITWDETTRSWVDVESDEAVAEEDIYDRYHDEVLGRIGVRRFHDDFGPHMPMVDNLEPELTTIYLDEELRFSVADAETAQSFVDSAPGASAHFDGEEWQVVRPAGSPIRVPRRVAMTRFVGGQIPEGFNPAVYGIPADMLDNLDRLALWNLVCTVEAFVTAGFSPAELLSAVHPARVSSTQGTGMGGVESLRSLYIDKLLAQARPNDILQEALPNVVAAHVMQSYVGGYGQMVHPVAACATAAVSVEEGVDKLRLHKADFVVAGGIDDLSIEGIGGFGDMAATADSASLEAQGIEHKYFSRANDRRRGGFIESAGGGTLLLARGDFAAEHGLPVHGVVGFAESFADGAHTSIPAPGLGALSAARGGVHSRLATSLAQLGVGADDIAIVSKHDTSTNANDPNESKLHERIAAELGRSAGNPLYVISQKSLTGHAKGGAAAFQVIGLTQVLRQGIIPPNRSLDCVDPELQQHSHLTWLRQPLDLRGTAPKAGLVTSLGFGHVSALVAIVHPQAFYEALKQARGEEAAQQWREQAKRREAAGQQLIDAAMYGGPVLYSRPADRNLGAGDVDERETAVLLSDDARLVDGVLDPKAQQ
ncbi:fatty acid synthase subunit beta domain-containing protein [Corynebacterium camporealensis]